MIRICCSNKVIIGDPASIPCGAEESTDAISMDPRFHTVFFSGLGDFFPMLIGTCEEEGLRPLALEITLQGVCENRCIGVPQVGLCIDVIQRGSDIHTLHTLNQFLTSTVPTLCDFHNPSTTLSVL